MGRGEPCILSECILREDEVEEVVHDGVPQSRGLWVFVTG
jgi:hypothetical protein